ncbi:MAG TPA: cardiolipin synthase ClsB [Burkholderiaceae bacterium]|nr:cardiolipin synthase ClsB [Burkholderiaceae bacterium]
MTDLHAELQRPGPDPPAARIVHTPWFDSLRPRLTEGNEVVLLESGREFFPRLIADVDSAQREVYLETYIFECDASGRPIADALARAARRGVAVHVLLDGFGAHSFDPQTAQALAQAGAQVQVYRPGGGLLPLDRKRLRRMHRKIVVVDGAIGYVGGMNVLDDHNDPNHGPLEHPRLDYVVRCRGPIVPAMHLAVARLWWQMVAVHTPLRVRREIARRQGLTALRPPRTLESDATPAGTMRAMLVLRDNLRWRKRIESAYLLAIRQAQREIVIANAYFLPGVRFRRALIRAARRGVKVRLLLQGRIEYALPHYATQALYDELLREGIEIVEYHQSFMHAKVAVIDDWATVGSSNIDPYSLLLAREANVFVLDAGFAALLRSRLLAAMTRGGRRIELKQLQRRGWAVRLLHWSAIALVRLGTALTGARGRY